MNGKNALIENSFRDDDLPLSEWVQYKDEYEATAVKNWGEKVPDLDESKPDPSLERNYGNRELGDYVRAELIFDSRLYLNTNQWL